jgi:hypothetical protein
MLIFKFFTDAKLAILVGTHHQNLTKLIESYGEINSTFDLYEIKFIKGSYLNWRPFGLLSIIQAKLTMAVGSTLIKFTLQVQKC